MLSCMSFLSILGINPLSNISYACIFSYSVGCIFILLCWGMFLLYPFCWEFLPYMGWILSKAFFASFEMIIRFFLQLFNVVYHIDWFVDKAILIMVYYYFNVLLNSVCLYFVENFCIYVCQWYWPIIFFFCDIFVWFWYQGDAGLIEWVQKCSFLCNIFGIVWEG